MAPPTDLPIHSFPSAAALEFFLEESYIKIPGFHLKIAKKSSGIPSVSAADAVQVALCFGWIDGQANSLDADWYLARYTPRRAKSIWSQKNVDTVNRLMQEIPCRMRPAGIAAVEAAKADGRWERAYAGPATMTVPKDFEAALAAEPAAERFFEAQNKTIRYSVLMKLYTGAEQTRAKRVAGLVQLLAEGKLPGKLNSGKRRLKSESKSVGKSTSTRKRKASLEEDDIPTRTKTRRAKGIYILERIFFYGYQLLNTATFKCLKQH